jgi:hypothetical protein
MLASLSFLAAADANFTGNTVMVLISLATGSAAIIGVFIQSRRQPPIGEQMHKEFATKQELESVRKEASDSMRRVHARIDALIESNDGFFRESERSRGHLLGKVESIERDLRELSGFLRTYLATPPRQSHSGRQST